MNKTYPLVSVIIPAYNSAYFLEIAVESALNQTYKNIEVIIVDDGSTDNTFEIAKMLSEKHSNVKVIKQINGKQGKARNTGINISSGEFIAFLDADDEWILNKIEIQLTYLFKYECDLVFTDGYLFITDKKNPLAEINRTTNLAIEIGAHNGIIQGNNGIKLLHIKNRIPTSSVLCKKEALIKVGLFNTNLEVQNCEDYLLWVNLVKHGYKLVGINEKLILYRVHPNSSTNGIKKSLFPLIKSIFEMGVPITNEQKIHLVKTFKTLFEDLYPNNEINLAKEIMQNYAKFAEYGKIKFLMLLCLKLNFYRGFLSLFYRTNRTLSNTEIDETNLILPL
jgi:teichuronic acid biosynthesis glycosyltransferase TuaG